MPSDGLPAFGGLPDLNGRHAVVTGGARGIGLGIAQALARCGARVSVVSRTATRHTDTSHADTSHADTSHADTSHADTRHPDTSHADTRHPDTRHPDTCHPERSEREAFAQSKGVFYADADLTREWQVGAALAACREAHGAIDILINNAGIAESAPVAKTSLDLWNRTLAANLTATFLCTRAVLPEMRAGGWGRIVNVASTAGLAGAPYVAAYTASKHGVVGFTRALAAEIQGTGVTANALCPGYAQTEMLERAVNNVVKYTGASESAARARLAAMNPEGRIVTVEEVARAALELLDGSSNGVALIVPGNTRA